MTGMKVDEQEEHIHIRADYSLDVNYEPLADCTIRIQVQPREAEGFSISDKMEFWIQKRGCRDGKIGLPEPEAVGTHAAAKGFFF